MKQRNKETKKQRKKRMKYKSHGYLSLQNPTASVNNSQPISSPKSSKGIIIAVVIILLVIGGVVGFGFYTKWTFTFKLPKKCEDIPYEDMCDFDKDSWPEGKKCYYDGKNNKCIEPDDTMCGSLDENNCRNEALWPEGKKCHPYTHQSYSGSAFTTCNEIFDKCDDIYKERECEYEKSWPEGKKCNYDDSDKKCKEATTCEELGGNNCGIPISGKKCFINYYDGTCKEVTSCGNLVDAKCEKEEFWPSGKKCYYNRGCKEIIKSWEGAGLKTSPAI